MEPIDIGLIVSGGMLLLVVLAQTGEIVFWQGALMLVALVAFMAWSYHKDKNDPATAELHEREAEEMQSVPTGPLVVGGYVIFGLAGLVIGADLLVRGAVNIASSYGIPESIIGLTLVALGTSLPELAATAVAAWRKHTDVAIANVIGSCLFNVLSILGITAMLHPLQIADDIRNIDVWIMLVSSLVLIPMLYRDRKICRLDAGILLAGYFAYIASLGWRLG